MNTDRERDRLLDEALKHQLSAGRETAASDDCLDAEALAAWMDGGLDAQAAMMAEAHASNCARCQALLATMARTLPAAAVSAPQGARLWRWWFAPLAATAAAVTLWMVVPQEPISSPLSAPAKEIVPADTAATQSQPGAPAPAPPVSAPISPAARDRAAVPPAPSQPERIAPREAPALGTLERKAEAPKLAENVAEGRMAAAAPPAPAPPAAALHQETASFTDAQVTARSSPSPDVIWVVGRAGLVQLATDGRTFAHVPFPETADLAGVTATDARHATVTTADGRTFQTADGGRTWRRQ